MNSSQITINLPTHRKEKLTRHILEEITTSIPEESLNEYAHPARIKKSLKNALKEWEYGTVTDKLS